MTMPLPRLTPEQFAAALTETAEQLVEMLRLARDAFLHRDRKPLERLAALGHDVHVREKRLTQQVAFQLKEAPWSLGPVESLAFAPAALERIGDGIEAIARCAGRIIQEGAIFSDRATEEIRTLFGMATDLVETIESAIKTRNRVLLRHLHTDGDQLQSQAGTFELAHQERLLHGICVPASSSLYLAMLDNFREIERYTRRIADAMERSAATS